MAPHHNPSQPAEGRLRSSWCDEDPFFGEFSHPKNKPIPRKWAVPLEKIKGPGEPGARNLLGYGQNVNVQPKQKELEAQLAAGAVPLMLRVKFAMIGIFAL